MNLKQFSLIALPLFMLGCSDPKVNTETTKVQQNYNGVGAQAVFGTVTYNQGIILPHSAKLTVKLQDTSCQDASAIVLAQQTVIFTSNAPWSFSMNYDPSIIKDKRNLTISARVEVDGQLYFINKHRIAAFDDSAIKVVVSPVTGLKNTTI